jgi:hypothetical protein
MRAWSTIFASDSGELEQKKVMFPLRRIPVERAIDDFFFNPDYSYLIGTSRDGGRAQIVNLIVGRTVKAIDIEGMPHLGSGIAWPYKGNGCAGSSEYEGG